MIKIKQTVVVEGKYDKIKLENIISANIITTDGFKIYNDRQKQALLKNIAEKTGIIILTDSDSAGRRIRGFIKSFINDADCEIINIYIPEILGKEKRKAMPSKENLLGVEGTDNKTLLSVFEKYGAENNGGTDRKISKLDFYEDGLTGAAGSAKKREYLRKRLDLPYLPVNALIEAANILIGLSEYKKIINELKD
ncbi:MAG: DUF4093 domain-containing protein [Oscillospiraceae bacterium]|nr:DUF4093 domain-containing protein [Oscillospiraceae bacterium]